jgi:parallel beta-helix repeat protein
MVSGIFLILFLVGTFALGSKIQPANAQNTTIYINSDGSVSPPSAPISTVDNFTYTLTGNISSTNDGIVVERSNIVIDGNGYTVQLSQTGNNANGLSLIGLSNVTVKNTSICDFWTGIYLDSSNGDNISGNNLTANGIDGIFLNSSSNNSITGNAFNGCGLSVWSSYENYVENNAVNGKPLVYLEGQKNYTVSDAGQVILVRCDSIRVQNLNLSSVDYGVLARVQLLETNNSIVSQNTIANSANAIWLNCSSNNSITGNIITANSGNAIWLNCASNNSITGNNITNNWYGIALEPSSNNNSINGNNIANNWFSGIDLEYSSNDGIGGNNITANNGYGIYLDRSSNNGISGNDITENNYYGIGLGPSSNNNSISGNNVTANKGYGISIGSSGNSIIGNTIANNKGGIYLIYSNNSIYHNNFVDNSPQVIIAPLSANTWDDGYPSGGNYWSDYNGTDHYTGQYQNITGSDGIGDTPYVIDANNTDNYPLMNPVTVPEFQPFLIPPLFMTATLLAVAIHRKTRQHLKIAIKKQQNG